MGTLILSSAKWKDKEHMRLLFGCEELLFNDEEIESAIEDGGELGNRFGIDCYVSNLPTTYASMPKLEVLGQHSY